MKNQIIVAVASLIASTAFTVSAQSVPVESITITPTSAKLAVGGSRTYKAEILPAEAAAGATVAWYGTWHYRAACNLWRQVGRSVAHRGIESPKGGQLFVL